eukprot:Gb_11534 [translate_table: standard]
MIYKHKMASLCCKSFKSISSVGPSYRVRPYILPQICRLSAPRTIETSYYGRGRIPSVRGACIGSRIVLDLNTSMAKTEGFRQHCNKAYVHSNGDKEAVLSDIHSKKPKEKENENGCNGIASSKFLTLPNILTLGRVAAVPLLIAGRTKAQATG